MTVETDEKWLFFMLSQLIHNAVKYSKGKAKPYRYRFMMRDGKEAVLEVKDYGVGIPETDKRRVFEPFILVKMGENLENRPEWDCI